MQAVGDVPVRVLAGLASVTLGLFSFRGGNATFDLKGHAVGAGHTEAGGITANLVVKHQYESDSGAINGESGRTFLAWQVYRRDNTRKCQQSSI